MIGQTIGNYRIEALLGSGGAGQVFRAVHVQLERQVAIKVLHSQYANDPASQARFLQEAKAAAALNHPNILEIYDFGEQNGVYYLVMALIRDGSLRTLLPNQTGSTQPMPLMLGIELVRQTAEGLAFAHSHQMVHRDIKPDNLLLSRIGGSDQEPVYQVKIADFGLARLAEGGGSATQGLTMGTPAYMSPEQSRGGELDGRSDIYSLGVVLYEVATGYLPFETKNLADAVYKHLYTDPPPPRQVRPDLSPELERIILRCLRKNPDERYLDAATLAAELQALLQPAQPAAPVQGTATVIDGPSMAGTLLVHPEQDRLSILPGHPIMLRVGIANLNATAEQVAVSVEGLPQAWVPGSIGPFPVEPGGQVTIEIPVAIERVATNAAGDYPVTIRARSLINTNVTNTASGTWTVLPFAETRLALEPARRGGRPSARFNVLLENQGNDHATYALTGQDSSNQLQFQFGQPSVGVDPGASVKVPLTVRGQQRWTGNGQASPFTILATRDGVPPQSISGEYVSLALMPVWLLSIAGLVFFAGLIGGGVMVLGRGSGGAGTPTASVATATATSQSVLTPTLSATTPTPIVAPTPTTIIIVPTPVPDRFVFATGRGQPPGILDIYVMDVNSASLQPITNDTTDDWTPFWSPDGTKIAFTSKRDGNPEIYVVNADGSNPLRLTNSPDTDEIPIWSPDSRMIAFTRTSNDRADVYLVNADGSNLRNLTNTGNAGEWSPEWTPDGRQIIFVSDRGGNRDIYSIGIDNNQIQRLTDHPADDDQPKASRDGSRIAFVSQRDGNRNIYLMNVDGSNEQSLTESPVEDLDPNWSPDGSMIAFASNRDGSEFEVYVMSPDGSAERRLSNDGRYTEWIEWSADNTRVAWVSRRDNNFDIYIVNVDGSNQTMLTDNATYDGNLDWFPIPQP